MVNIYKYLNSEQLNLLNNHQIVIKNKEYSDDEYLDVEDQITELLQVKGMSHGEVNEVGLIIEDIINVIVKL